MQDQLNSIEKEPQLDIMSNFNMRRIIKLGKRHGARR
jgi:hypothetical protein